MKYATIKKYDVANGPGVRVSIFVSGCNHHCKGCFNEEAWDFNYGTEFTDETISIIIDAMRPDYISGLSILGGEPFEHVNQVGLLKVLWASLASAVTKLFGKKGVFYEIVGQEVSGLDGFYDHVWKEYGDIGILLPENPSKVCNEIHDKLGISCMIVDANDLGQEVIGHSDDIKLTEEELKGLIRDNPTGQGHEQTPLILIRKKSANKE